MLEIMPKKFLLGGYEVPGYGGASTVAYRMFEDLQAQGFDVAFVNLIGQDIAPYLQAVYGSALGNPRGLANVHNLVLERAPFYPAPAHENLARLIQTLSPDVVIGNDFIAVLLLKASAPDKRVIFITAGCDQAKQALLHREVADVTELLRRIDKAKAKASQSFRLPPHTPGIREAQAVANADLILLHSDMMRPLFEYYFPAHAVKLFPETLWFAEWIDRDAAPYTQLRQPFAERAIDVLFVASLWKRIEKNWTLAREIILRHPEWNIHVVGESVERAGHATYHELLADRAKLFELMGQARVVVSPSRLDAAPGVLWEAVAMGCNIVATKNCGNWELCHPALLAHSLRAEEFGERIRAARVREYKHNAEKFLQPSARQTLREILEVFCE
jgi:glycosyltransferase involved in cell wall biosynthesis